MPKPKKNEPKQEFISRCISFMTKEGKYKDKQIAAICYLKYDQAQKESCMKEIISFKNFLKKDE